MGGVGSAGAEDHDAGVSGGDEGRISTCFRHMEIAPAEKSGGPGAARDSNDNRITTIVQRGASVNRQTQPFRTI